MSSEMNKSKLITGKTFADGMLSSEAIPEGFGVHFKPTADNFNWALVKTSGGGFFRVFPHESIKIRIDNLDKIDIQLDQGNGDSISWISEAD